MNIQDAKDTVKDAVRSYLARNDSGGYSVPKNRQRPIMLLGAPGLGKTAVMSQIADELGIGYVSYTITHHTRQSAIGLPMIETRTFQGVEHPMTRYTMSEIVSTVYEAIEAGHPEGILFIDEINCVSETLAPAMLDLLQNKRFGPHPIPDGWILVAAGNPPEYNASAREFDIATLDRIRVVEVDPDTDVWVRYAMSHGVHEAITYYLQVKPQNLLKIERTVNGPVFVTPRGWEDLSAAMRSYDGMGFDVDVNLISQYVRDPDIAAEFHRYLGFHRKYRMEYDVDGILDTGRSSGASDSSPEARLAVISVMIGRLNDEASLGMGLEGAEAARVRASFDRHLTNAVSFLEETFGKGQEVVSLLIGLIGCRDAVLFSDPSGPLYAYNDEYLSAGRSRRIMDGLEALRWRTASTPSPPTAACA